MDAWRILFNFPTSFYKQEHAFREARGAGSSLIIWYFSLPNVGVKKNTSKPER